MNMSLLTCAAGCAAITALAHPDDDDKYKDKHKDRRHGEEITKAYDFKDFDRIEVSGVYELDVTVGEKFSIVLEGEEDELERADVRLAGGALELGMKGKGRRWGKHDHHGIEARVTLPDLKAIDVSGVVDGEVTGIKADAFEIKVSGVGDMDFSGQCKTLKARISGVGDVEAEDLRCEDVDVHVSGVGDASVYASKVVDATVSGMGDIEVFGSPEKVRETSSMFSEVTIR